MLSIGDKVRKRNQQEKVGIITKVSSERGIFEYEVDFIDHVEYFPEEGLILFTGQKPLLQNLKSATFSNFYDFQKALTFLKLSNSSSIQNNIYAFNTSKTVFYEYQFKPLLKLINSYKRRLLICDEVGLGKTIEAGLIYKELKARNEVQTALIIVPANLREKWRSEMYFRFQEEFNVIDGKFFMKLCRGDSDAAGQYRSNKFIVSLESIRSKESIDLISDSDFHWDLVIIDEAHSLRNTSQQHRAIQTLSSNVTAMVMLTATPIHTSSDNLFNILNILDENQFPYKKAFEDQRKQNEPFVNALNAVSAIPPNMIEVLHSLLSVDEDYKINKIYRETYDLTVKLLKQSNQESVSIEDIVKIQRNLSDMHLIGGIYNRTKKSDVHTNRPIRKPQTILVELSQPELDLYNSIVTSTKLTLLNKSLHNNLLPLFSVQRMLSSSLHAHYKPILSNKNLIDDSIGDYEKMIYEEGEDSIWNTDSMDNIENDLVDSKLQKLFDVLKEASDKTTKVILFAFYIDTLLYLQSKIAAKRYRVYLLTSAIPISERTALIDSFRKDSGFSILLSSRVGSEGIDLQFCDTMINYDLPWNPMEIEQRIGRIDRIGQTSQVINIINFGLSNTIDDRIIMRLYDRIKLFEGTIGLLEPIMGELMEDINKNILFIELSQEEKEKRWFEQEKVILNRIKDTEHLESSSAELLSLDYYYEHEIKDIHRKKRYVTPEHLLQYISGYLNQRYRDSYIRYDNNTNEGTIQLCQDFRKSIQGTIYEKELFYSFAPSKKVSFTFSSDYAFANPQIPFISILHPLVSFITYQYNLDKSNIHNCHYFLVSQEDLNNNGISDLTEGYYFYFVFHARISGIKEHSIIMYVILDEELTPLHSTDLTEHVMGVVNDIGRHSVQELACNDKEYLEGAYNIAFDHFKNRFDEYYNDYVARQELILERKRKSKEFHFTRKITQRKNELATLSFLSQGNEDSSFRRKMLEAQILKGEQDLAKAIEDIDLESNSYKTFEAPLYGGVFEVKSGMGLR